MARLRAVLTSLVVLGALAFPLSTASSAAAAGAHRARVIVDTGGQTIVRDISFDGTITGIQALQLAGANPVVYTFNGQGGAVCRLFGVGRDAGPGCLGGADSDPSYWAYFRAPAGTSSFTYSRAGAGSVEVHDGDVEGWRWGTGAAPAWSAPPAPTTTTTAAPVGGGGSGAATGGGAVAPTAPGAAPAGGGVAPGATFDPEAVEALARALNASSTTTTTAPAAGTDVAGARRVKPAARRAVGALTGDDGDGGGGSAGSLLLLGGVLAAMAAGGVYLRRTRRRPIR